MAHKITNALAAATLIVVAFLAYLLVGLEHKMDESLEIPAPQTVTFGNVSTTRREGEGLEDWAARHQAAVAAFEEEN